MLELSDPVPRLEGWPISNEMPLATGWRESARESAVPADERGSDAAPIRVFDVTVDEGATCASADALARWMTLIQRRDEAGLRQLHSACRRRVYRSAVGIVRHEHIANEVVSATFMQVWSNAAQYDATRGSVMAWIMLMTRSRSLDALRHANAIRQHEICMDEQDDSMMLSDDRAASPLQSSERRCRRINLQRALLRLPSMQRQVVTLTTLGGLSQEDAARYLSLPLGTVKSHARRGLGALRQHCEALGLGAD